MSSMTWPDVEVVLIASFPPLVRIPDLCIVSLDAARPGPKRYQANQAQVVGEILSPGSARTDRIMKMADYAEAGIPNYRIIDLDGPVTLDAFSLEDGTYQPVLRSATGRVAVDVPVPMTLDLAALVP